MPTTTATANVQVGFLADSTWTTWTTTGVEFYSTTNVTTTVGIDPWYAWSATGTLTVDLTWNNWITPQANIVGANVITAPTLVTTRTERTEAEWAELRAEQNRLAAKRDALQAAARAEARNLLKFVLSPEQFDSYEKHQFFYVTGSEGGVYKVKHGVSGNISRIIDGREVNALCAHPRMLDSERNAYLPTEDCVAAQTLALMHDERGFVTLANVHRGQRHLAAVPDLVAA